LFAAALYALALRLRGFAALPPAHAYCLFAVARARATAAPASRDNFCCSRVFFARCCARARCRLHSRHLLRWLHALLVPNACRHNVYRKMSDVGWGISSARIIGFSPRAAIFGAPSSLRARTACCCARAASLAAVHRYITTAPASFRHCGTFTRLGIKSSRQVL
jgi:hypothetical protein